MLRRFWVEPDSINGSDVVFEGDSFHHLVRVSRKNIGDQVEVLDGSGVAYAVKLTQVKKSEAMGTIISKRELPKPNRPYVNLAFCFPKPSHFEIVLEKAVELGCHEITPILNEYSFVTKKQDFPDQKKSGRWQKIIKAATEQTGRADLMTINSVLKLDEFLGQINQKPRSLCLFLYEGECPLNLRQFMRQQDITKYDEVWALVGSEGGFSANEVTLLKDKGFTPLSLGKQILRTETACVSILSVLQYESGHLS